VRICDEMEDGITNVYAKVQSKQCKCKCSSYGTSQSHAKPPQASTVTSCGDLLPSSSSRIHVRAPAQLIHDSFLTIIPLVSSLHLPGHLRIINKLLREHGRIIRQSSRPLRLLRPRRRRPPQIANRRPSAPVRFPQTTRRSSRAE
jgi:hypothetical protein